MSIDVGDIVQLINDDQFNGRVLMAPDGCPSIKVSFDMTFGPDRVEWLPVEYLRLVEKASRAAHGDE